MRIDHPHDPRLRAEITSEASLPVVELWMLGDQTPTVRFAADGEEGWEPAGPTPAWQAIELLASMGFCSVSEVAEALGAVTSGMSALDMSRRMRTFADLVEILGLNEG